MTDLTALGPKLRAAFARDGYVRIDRFPASLPDIEAALRQLIDTRLASLPREDVYFDNPGDQSSLKQIQRLQEHEPFFADLMASSPFEQLACILLEQPVEGRNLQYFDKPPGTSVVTPPHQDGFYFMLEPPSAVTLWFALDDVAEDQGCVRYLPGSHRLGLRPHAGSGILGFSQQIADDDPAAGGDEVACPCKAGDLIGHHALTIHRAEPNQATDRRRRALGFIYYGRDAKVDEAAHAAYQKRLSGELAQRGRI